MTAIAVVTKIPMSVWKFLQRYVTPFDAITAAIDAILLFFVCENVTHIPMDCFVWCLWRALSELVASNFGVMVVQFPKRNVDIYYGEK